MLNERDFSHAYGQHMMLMRKLKIILMIRT